MTPQFKALAAVCFIACLMLLYAHLDFIEDNPERYYGLNTTTVDTVKHRDAAQ